MKELLNSEHKNVRSVGRKLLHQPVYLAEKSIGIKAVENQGVWNTITDPAKDKIMGISLTFRRM